ncbi:alcohol dehydrogenase catalytic domain-containing protein [Nonomuraea sp. NPDC052129]|uniref:alcohol dehydrogenase catalytic domain-containing protein n=1 Tax=Nonomuraea sp. NPDC052129 TaxID=3154651 RepID=UPI00343837F8
MAVTEPGGPLRPVEATGAPAVGWEPGDWVAVGWSGGSCRACRTGDQVHCRQRRIPGLSHPGGWAETVEPNHSCR